jgi:hypothetical protein
MSRPNPKGIFDEHVAEILAQQGFSSVEDPRSVYDPQQLYTSLERYATDWAHFEHLDEHLKFGFRKAYQIFAKPKGWKCLKALSDVEVMRKALKLGKSSGLPMMTTKANSLTYSFDRERQIRLGIKAPNPCVAYKRTQRGNKTRLVWGYPLEMTIMEARFARPLIEMFLCLDTAMAFGRTKLDLGARLHRYFTDSPGTTVCLDYSKYDSTVSKCMVKEAFRILSTWFEDDDLKALGWDTVVTYFIHTPIVMPDGHLYCGKNHGVPSGSYFTQMIDSIVNVALTYGLSHKFGFSFKRRSLYVLGDDVIVQVLGTVRLEQWSRYLASFGLQLHGDEKTVVGQTHFLGAIWDKGKPDAPIQELVNKACFPEDFRDYQGQPDTGAESVLRSYATCYLSAHLFISTGIRLNARIKDQPPFGPNPGTQYLTGSDKFLAEERALIRGTPDRDERAFLCELLFK